MQGFDSFVLSENFLVCSQKFCCETLSRFAENVTYISIHKFVGLTDKIAPVFFFLNSNWIIDRKMQHVLILEVHEPDCLHI